MRILVTGGFGFLGSHLIELLLENAEDTVHVVDNLSTSPLPLELLLDEIGRPSRLTYSIQDMLSYCEAWDAQPFDEIYHLASVVGPAGVLQHSGRIAKSILDDTMAVARLASNTGAVLVDISTSEVYGGGQEGYCSESMARIVHPGASARLEYAVGKLAAETSLLNLCRFEGLRARIVRPFNISGPRQSGRGGFVLPRFIGQAMSGQEITVFGDGAQVRAFTHVRDLVDGIVLVARKGRDGEAYNLGNPLNRCTVLELAQDVIDVTASSSSVTFVDPKTIYGAFYEEANDKYPDAAKAMTELGWQPRFDRRATVADTFAYMQQMSPVLLRDVAAV